jgi:hypothetical protein
MAVTKQEYPMTAGFTSASVANALRSALIDAGLMAEWFDSFAISGDRICRVLQIVHDPTKTYGTCFYYFIVENGGIAVALATNGWDATAPAPINVPTGTQYLDWHTLPASCSIGPSQLSCTTLFNYSTTSNLVLDRFTSGSDTKQSWFVFRQTSTVTRSRPFTFLHKDMALHSWIDLSKGCISGLTRLTAATSDRAGLVNFQIDENLRRCLSVGPALQGSTSGSNYHAQQYNAYSYFGAGSSASGANVNFPNWGGSNKIAATPLPVGRNAANPAYTSDYVPVCSNIPWNLWTPTRLADDFGVYMRYDSNDIALGDRFVVQAATNEWQVLDFANNAVLNDGASASFLARII